MFLNGIFCRYLLNPSSLMCHLRELSVYLSFWYELLIHFCKSIKVLCCCSVMQLCPTLCNPMDCNTPGLPVLHHCPKFAQVHVHCINDAVQLSHSLTPSCPSVPASGTFPMSHLFALDDQNTGASASASRKQGTLLQACNELSFVSRAESWVCTEVSINCMGGACLSSYVGSVYSFPSKQLVLLYSLLSFASHQCQ